MEEQAFPSVTVKRWTACGVMDVTLVFNSGGKVSGVFPRLGKGFTCKGLLCGVAGNLAGRAIQLGVPISSVVAAMKGTACPEAKDKRSCLDAIAGVLDEHGGSNAPPSE
jgi:hypothetical protein